MSARRPDLYNKRQVNGGISEAKAGMTQGNTKIIMMVICGMAVLMMLMFKDSGKSVQTRGDCPTMGQLRSQVLVKASQDIFFDTFDAINHTDRIRAVGQPGATLWMTGLSGSGKSTIGKALERRLVLDDSVHMYRLDGDNLRFGLSKDLRLSAEDRAEAVRRAYEVSLMMADSGTLSLVSLISPYRKDRDTAREVHERLRIPFIEVFVKVDISVAEERDPKGLYKKVREGKIKGMTGIDAPYEKPLKPEITLNTGTCCENTAAEERLKTCKSEAKNLPVKTKFQDHCPPILEQCINACVDQLRDELIAKKVINTNKKSPQQIGAPVDCPKAAETNKHHEKQPGEEAMGHADGYPDGTTPPNVIEENEEFWKSDTVTILQPVTIRDVDVQWVQVIGEGWAAPLKGPMRESALVQALHFNSMLVDPSGDNGGGSSGHGPGPAGTDFGDSKGAARMVHNGERVSMPVPIAIPVSSHTKMLINRAQKKGGKVQLVLVSPAGEPVAILDDPEVYAFRKEEMITRSWGSWDLHHPYIKENIIEAGEYLLGGELSKVRRIKYNDGLDQWRLTPEELIRKFKEKGADGVFAFQTRNPTHAGHAHLMKDGRKQLLEKGYRNPVLWLSPLGGWTKSDDVPLDIRVKQHQAVLDEGMLDKAWTVLAIWPSPMVYSGPTEVQWHAKSRRVAGADYFIVGRDPAGLSYSDEYAQAHNQKKGDDVYEPDHGRYVLQVSPGMGKLGLLASGAVHYDKTDGEMKPKPAGITKDEFNNRFLKISGSKMRQMGRMMVDVCDSIEAIPATWSEDPKCVPPKFMVPSGWKIMREYYKSKDEPLVKANAVLQSKQIPTIAKQAKMVNATKVGLPGELFAVYLTNEAGATISPWHDVPLKTGEHFNMVVEFPKGTNSKFEVQKELPFNPIKQDVKNKVPRHYTYGMSFFNNGLFPQTWEDGSLRDEEGNLGDNDPLDVMEIGSISYPMGSVVPVKVLGSLAMVDSGETDWKVIAISLEDPDSSRINDIASLKAIKGDALVDRIVNWLRFYKTTDKKTPDEASPNTFLKNAEYQSVTETLKVIEHTNQRWSMLRAGTADKTDKTQHFWLKE
eukprot:TRINITY_DN1951_c0_g2_i1.p1 TRINITY_DN1951_c0_g2~~TRINITY_DN1951_c0_g2_i1.p1  ORF type:complete len:1088 (+),score=341.12 TRINITY_DN1951_c0_g2_i1:39-3302(+)